MPRLDAASRTACVLASIGDQPFGYMQWYLNRSYPEYGIELLHREFGVSIDYFIGDPSFLGRGLGSVMLVALLSEIEPNLAPEDRVFRIAHAVTFYPLGRLKRPAGGSPPFAELE